MTRYSDKRLFAAGSISILLLCGFAVPSSLHPHANQTSSAIEVPIVVTAAPAYEPLAALGLDQSSDPSVAYAGERFPRSAHLLILRNGRAESLLPQFFASADPNVSFDAQKMLFAGRQYAEDPWKIWEMNLADRSVRKVISAESDLIRPFYLPGSRVVYARRTLTSFQVETASLDGTEVLQLTYLNSSALPVDVLLDGRILFESGFPLGTAGKPELYLVYSDGSGVESYRCDHGTARWGGHQLASGPNAGDIVFSHGQSLGRFTSPLGAEAVISTPAAAYAGSIAETRLGAWLVSSRTVGQKYYSLAVMQGKGNALHPVFSDDANNLVEPALVAERPTPKHHPSSLHDWTTANLLALDARQSREGTLQQTPATVRLESEDPTGHAVNLGTAQVESDGSFFVKTPADRPIRFTLLDRDGATLRAEHGWFWIRSGEQRICVGCHTGPERAPENRVPQVLLHSTIPTDLSGHQATPAAGGR